MNVVSLWQQLLKALSELDRESGSDWAPHIDATTASLLLNTPPPPTATTAPLSHLLDTPSLLLLPTPPLATTASLSSISCPILGYDLISALASLFLYSSIFNCPRCPKRVQGCLITQLVLGAGEKSREEGEGRDGRAGREERGKAGRTERRELEEGGDDTLRSDDEMIQVHSGTGQRISCWFGDRSAK